MRESFLCLFILRSVSSFKPDHTDGKRIRKAFFFALLDDLAGVLGINDLNENLFGQIVSALFLIRHYLKDQEALLALVTVADRVTFADEGLSI